MATGKLRRYRLKDEFKTLFSNLATGNAFMPRDALRDAMKPTRKSYSEEEIRNRVREKETALLEKLEKAGFVDTEDETIEYEDGGK